MRAFIVRPFGKKNDIDFDAVQATLIEPALAGCDIQGGTTAVFLQAGNIRTDMFQQLLVADIVIADISIHNANVFYELGIRHALQPRRTFLLRARSKRDRKERGPEDEVPFDLRTDRYLEYDADRPAEKLGLLQDALRQTLASEKTDSPVFQMLPDLEAQDRARFLPVPQTFRDDVELAFKGKQLGLLGLLATEATDYFWASEGLRLVARAQFDSGTLRQAKQTWEELHKLNPAEIEANQRLGTIYQRMRDLDASDQALHRVLANKDAPPKERGEAYSLIARNIKQRWRESWMVLGADQAPSKALESPLLLKAYEKYKQGFQEDLDSFYPGLNALSLATIAIELAKKLPDVWENRFDTKQQADGELESLGIQRGRLAGAVGLSLEAAQQRLQRDGGEDRWLEISLADYQFLTSSRPTKVAFAYQSALAGAPDFYLDAAQSQLELFGSLGVMEENTKSALGAFQTPSRRRSTPARPTRAILFTGHMIDPPDLVPPRFPDALKHRARQEILRVVKQEVERTKGNVVGVASAANGGDLLFHDVCEELGIEQRLYLPLPPDVFRNESVSPAGRLWEERFDKLLAKFPAPPCLTTSQELPLWLSTKKDYTTWQRANIWLIQEALALQAEKLTLLALWDGVERKGLGGTFHMRTVAQECGAALVTVFIADLVKAEVPALVSA